MLKPVSLGSLFLQSGELMAAEFVCSAGQLIQPADLHFNRHANEDVPALVHQSRSCICALIKESIVYWENHNKGVHCFIKLAFGIKYKVAKHQASFFVTVNDPSECLEA